MNVMVKGDAELFFCSFADVDDDRGRCDQRGPHPAGRVHERGCPEQPSLLQHRRRRPHQQVSRSFYHFSFQILFILASFLFDCFAVGVIARN